MMRAIRDRRAATAVEYGLMIAMIVLVMLAGLGPLAALVQGLWQTVGSTVAAPR